MNSKNNSSSGGLGISGVLGVVFIVLKLVGVIDWSWWWVLLPFWITLGLAILILLGMYCYYIWNKKKRKKRINKIKNK